MKVNFFTLFFLMNLSLLAQEAWVEMNPFPKEVSIRSSFVTPNAPYVLDTDDDLFKYDVYTDSWEQKNSYEDPFNYGYIALSLDDGAYMLSGDGENNSIAIRKYNEEEDTWSTIGNRVFENMGLYGLNFNAFSNGSKIYIVSTASTATYDNFLSYDVNTNTWEDLGNLPFSSIPPKGFYRNGKGYFLFGFNMDILEVTKEFWEYDIEANEWTEKPSYPFFLDFYTPSAVFNIGDHVYVGKSLSAQIFARFNFNTDQWQQIEPCGDFSGGAGSFEYNNYGYVVAGCEYLNVNECSNIDHVWRLDPQLLDVTNPDSLSFEIFPNPTQDIIEIEGVLLDVSYAIYNTKGDVVKKGITNDKTIDLRALSSGMYFLSIKHDGNNGMKKILKL